MKPKNQVITIDQAKKFKELGVCQKSSLCVWAYQCMSDDKKLIINEEDLVRTDDDYAAFTTSELGLMFIAIKMQLPLINMANFMFGRENASGNIIQNENEARARVLFLIDYLELLQKVNHGQFDITIAKINQLLTQ